MMPFVHAPDETGALSTVPMVGGGGEGVFRGGGGLGARESGLRTVGARWSLYSGSSVVSPTILHLLQV